MQAFAPAGYGQAKRIVVLAATYGDGVEPASAKGFLDRFAALPDAPKIPLAVLGFGDRSFSALCGYAHELAAAATGLGWPMLLTLANLDRQSPQDFARWGRDFGVAIGVPLELNHQPSMPESVPLTLISRRNYGAEVQAATAILRFALPRRPLWHRLTGRGLAGFAAGDLLAILPDGSPIPRFYSLTSARQDEFAEICVSRFPGGLCLGQLLDLAPGDAVRAFIRANPDLRPTRGRGPIILIGAGAGIRPLAGFARANAGHRPMHL